MNWWTEELTPTQTLKSMIMMGALNGAVLVLLVPRFTSVGEVLGVIAAVAFAPIPVLIKTRRFEDFRSTRLKIFLGFSFVCIVFGALGYVYRM